MKPHFVIVNQNISSNALGRALSMALVAKELGETTLISFGRGKIWPGVSQFDTPVLRVSRNWRKDLDRVLLGHRGHSSVVWLSKGLDPLSKVASYVRRRYPDTTVILDLDDDDAALAIAFRKSSMTNHLKLSWFRRGNPWRIRKSQDAIASVADSFTFSTHALATRYPNSYVPYARVPHVRVPASVKARQSRLKDGNLHFGCFGTLRPHKGSQLLLDIMRADRDLTLVTFRNCGLGVPLSTDCNWLEIDPATPLDRAYANIDVAVIPITDSNAGAQYQLPAKIVDAMRARVPIVATPTPAIEEIAGDAISPLRHDQTYGEIIGLIRKAAMSNLSHSSGNRFMEVLTPQAAAVELENLLGRKDCS